MKIGVCLSGGGIPGIFAHIGFIKALEDLGINYHCIIGTSAGAIISAYAACGYDSNRIAEIALNLSKSDYFDLLPWNVIAYRIFKRGKNLWGFLKGDALLNLIRCTLPTDDFSKTNKKLYIHAANLDFQKEVIFETGTISDKVRASSAIPLVYEPMIINGQRYGDGGITGRAAEEGLVRLENPDIVIVHSPKDAKEFGPLKEQDWLVWHIIKRIIETTLEEFDDLKFKISQNGKTRIVEMRPKLSEDGVGFLEFNKESAIKLIEKSREETKNLLLKDETMAFLGGRESWICQP